MSSSPESDQHEQREWQGRRWQISSFFMGAALLIILAAAVSWPAPVEALDIEQGRSNVPLPSLLSVRPFTQSFRPAHDNLVEIELLLARVSEGDGGTLTLHLHDDAGHLVASQTWPANELRDGSQLTLRFPPQPSSSGKSYTLSLTGSGQNPFSFWGYDLDVYSGGSLDAPEATAQDLRFVTRYRLQPISAVQTIAADLWQNGGIILLALALLLLPGSLLLLAVPRGPIEDAAAWLGTALALGVGAWPLLWYWLTLAGARWRDWSLAVALIAGWSAVIILWRRRPSRAPRSVEPAHFLLLALLLLAFAVRLLAVRDLTFPPWVDPTRHALISRVMAADGQIVRDYTPFLDVERFPYHFGFHTLSASLLLLAPTALPELLLTIGQLLNALVPLTMYACTWLVTQRRKPAVLVAFLVAFPFYFPAYYASWGRFTQLTGVLLLPILIGWTWQTTSANATKRPWWLVGVLSAGLAVIHFRVFLVYLPFAAIAWLVAGRGRATRPLAAAAALSLLLVGPRLWELSGMRTGSLANAGTTYNEFPFAYVTVGWERRFLVAGGVALLLATVAALRGRSWGLRALALAAWSGTVLLLLSFAPTTWLINLNSAYIMFFIPLALILGFAIDALETWLQKGKRWAVPGYFVLGIALAGLLLFGVRQQIDVLNPVTRLARPADLVGIKWVDENLPAGAKLAVNSWHWLGAAWAGSDGGAWLLPVTGRQTTTPPADYVYNRELVLEVAAFNEAAQAVEDWSDPAAASWLEQQGVTHIFVGARGGFFDPSELVHNPALNLAFSQDGVFVFEINDSVIDSVRVGASLISDEKRQKPVAFALQIAENENELKIRKQIQ